MLVLSFPQRQAQFSSQLGAVEERDVPGQVNLTTVKEIAAESTFVQYVQRPQAGGRRCCG
jgi:hypothetical protein